MIKDTRITKSNYFLPVVQHLSAVRTCDGQYDLTAFPEEGAAIHLTLNGIIYDPAEEENKTPQYLLYCWELYKMNDGAREISEDAIHENWNLAEMNRATDHNNEHPAHGIMVVPFEFIGALCELESTYDNGDILKREEYMAPSIIRYVARCVGGSDGRRKTGRPVNISGSDGDDSDVYFSAPNVHPVALKDWERVARRHVAMLNQVDASDNTIADVLREAAESGSIDGHDINILGVLPFNISPEGQMFDLILDGLLNAPNSRYHSQAMMLLMQGKVIAIPSHPQLSALISNLAIEETRESMGGNRPLPSAFMWNMVTREAIDTVRAAGMDELSAEGVDVMLAYMRSMATDKGSPLPADMSAVNRNTNMIQSIFPTLVVNAINKTFTVMENNFMEAQRDGGEMPIVQVLANAHDADEIMSILKSGGQLSDYVERFVRALEKTTEIPPDLREEVFAGILEHVTSIAMESREPGITDEQLESAEDDLREMLKGINF